MDLFKTALELVLKLLNMFTGSKKKEEEIEKAVKDATSAYEQTTDIPSNVRESHQKVKSKLREAWERRWGSMNKNDKSEDSQS